MKSLAVCLCGLAIVVFALPAKSAEFHVAPDGSSKNDGSAAKPWDLQTALAHPPAVRAGDTIWLHGGTYTGAFKATLKGMKEAPIIVRQFPAQRATIDCRADKDIDPLFIVDVRCEYTTFWGFEVMCSAPNRVARDKGSAPPDIRRGGISCGGSGIKFVNLIVHDTAQGFGFWTTAGESGEIYGCIIYNNGWSGPDRGHGHAIYTQNRDGTRRLVDNIMFNQFGYGIHAYGSSRAFISGFHIEGNVAFNNGSLYGEKARAPDILVGGSSPSERIALIGNFTWRSPMGANVRLGYGPVNADIVVKDNYFAGGVQVELWKQAQFTGNTIVGPGALVSLSMPAGEEFSAYRWSGNRYFTPEKQAAPISLAIAKTGGALAFDQWKQKTGFDADSTLEQSRPKDAVFVRPNQYEPGRANIIVYNWEKREQVEVDLKQALKAGQKYRIVSAQNVFGEPVASGAYDGKPISLPMKPTPAAKPVGMPDFAPPVTEPEFGVFVVVPEEVK